MGLKFVFDFDGTLTAAESVPMIARRFGVAVSEICAMTGQATDGSDSDYATNFLTRASRLAGLPVDEVSRFVASDVPLHEPISRFIASRPDRCAIVSANLRCWCAATCAPLGCAGVFTEATVSDNRIESIGSVTDKREAIRTLRNSADRIVFVGDGHNDCGAMQEADFAIAFGPNAAPSARRTARMYIPDPVLLVNFLNRLK